MIYILTGDIRTGKTSALLKWSEKREDVDGILCPDYENGKRYFLKINSKETFPLEVESDSNVNQEKIIQVGPFNFLKSAFEKANDYLIQTFKNKAFKYLIIDELGKLELKNEGLHSSAVQLVKPFEFDENTHLILVVRSTLIAEIIQKYHIAKYELVEKATLKNLS